MFRKLTIPFLLLACMCAGCRQQQPDSPPAGTALQAVAKSENSTRKAIIEARTFYETIPSASGMESHNGLYYVIGDDSPYLYVLDKDFKQLQQVALTDTAGFSSGRISKDVKQDLECMTKVMIEDKPYLLVLGSGASPVRQKAYLVNIAEPLAPVVQQYSLKEIYQKLQQDKRVVLEELLNIEGAAAGNGKLYLLQRAIHTGNNILLTYDLKEFIDFLKNSTAAKLPAYTASVFRLEQFKGYSAGFSGAYLYDDKLFFTASVESAPNAIVDGEVLGSFIGFIPLAVLEADAATPLQVSAALMMRSDGSAYTGKAESLVVLPKAAAANAYTVLAVTDDDQGHSELLKLRVELGEE